MRTVRRLPRWSELEPYLHVEPIRLRTAKNRVTAAHTVSEIRDLARRRTPRPVFDYVDGAAEEEISLRRSREAYSRVEFEPRVLRDVSSIDTRTEILNRPSALPLVLAPTGFTRLMNHEGERAVARAAMRLGVPYGLSTLGTTSPEDLASAVPNGNHWFQLYLWRDRETGVELVERAQSAGFTALVLTVDTPVAGSRLRDARNGFTIPPRLSGRTIFDIGRHPGWWFNLLTTEPLTFASLARTEGTVADLINRVFDPTLTIADVVWLRDIWKGPIVVKGILNVEDAKAVADAGVAAIVVSNHGGRQLDRAVVPVEQLPRIVDAVGDRVEVYVDGGVMSGADIVASVALGARACLVGRAYLYGLMAAGEQGVSRVGTILQDEIVRTMRLLGTATIADLDRTHVRWRSV